MLLYILAAVVGLTVLLGRRRLYPKPYPGIPYNVASAGRLMGDMAEIVAAMRATDEATESIFTVSTRNSKILPSGRGTPIAQILFPRIRAPLIAVEDFYESEDILTRRQHEFDKAPTSADVFMPMFPKGSLAQYTTPELKRQKKLWSEAMRTGFLRETVAPGVRECLLDLVELWQLRAKGKLGKAEEGCIFDVLEDFRNAALDTIWLALVGEKTGITRYEIAKLRTNHQSKDRGDSERKEGGEKESSPKGIFVKAQVAYITDTIARNAQSPVPTWAQKLEMYTPRYRKFRRVVTNEISQAIRRASERHARDDGVTCMMDLVLRRRILEAEKEGKAPSDPATDQHMLDEMLIILVGVR
jgi:hypothetical protein